MTTTDGKTYAEVVRELFDDGTMTSAEDGAVEIVPTDLASVLAILKTLGAARHEEERAPSPSPDGPEQERAEEARLAAIARREAALAGAISNPRPLNPREED